MNDVALREYIEAIIREHDRRHSDLRQADLDNLEQYKKETSRALKLAKENADKTIALILSGIALLI